MKIILLKDVPKVGQKHDVKEVAEGFAHHFLFPKKLAIVATAKGIASFEKEREKAKQASDERIAHLGLIDREEENPQNWKLRKTQDTNSRKFEIDRLVSAKRSANLYSCIE